MAVPRARIQDLLKLQCRIFNQSYNPKCIRTGNSVLRERLRGPALAAYYPPRWLPARSLAAELPELEFFDEAEGEREDGLAFLRSKGKGPPKKKRTAAESKKFKGKKKAPAAAAAAGTN